GVLALLDAAQLAFALERDGALGVEQVSEALALLLCLVEPLLQAGDMAFERVHGGFGGLRAANERRVAAVGGPQRAPLGEDALLAARTLGGLAPAGPVGLLHHAERDGRASAGRLRRRSGVRVLRRRRRACPRAAA